MCKEGWSIGLGQVGVSWGEDAWNTLKGGGTEKREGETKIFERGGKQGQEARGRCLKKGDWNPLRNYDPIKTFTSNPIKAIIFLGELSMSTRVVQESNLNQILS